jgi:hypothetical protein
MNLNLSHNIILVALAQEVLLTEHELIEQIVSGSSLKQIDVSNRIGRLLTELKDFGLIWAGQMFNKNNQYMWAAALTKAGKDYLRETV